MKKTKIQEIKELCEKFCADLKEKEIELRKYCHYKKCTADINDCPQECCSKKLRLDTGIAWLTADRLNSDYTRLSWNLEAGRNVQFFKKEIKKIRDRYYNKTDVAVCALGLHDEKFPKLHTMITEIDNLYSKITEDVSYV